MILPNDEVGISDILTWRECAAKFAHGMQRHEAPIPGEDDWTNAYGSAVHEAIALVEKTGCSNGDAVTEVWPKYAAHLDPDDLALLNEDLDKYRGDVPVGFESIGAELERRVPLFTHEGVRLYFRFKIDALYRSIAEPGIFYMRDYKSSKWPKSQAEVDSDLQMWAYNWGVHELYPECDSLLQSYEQLRHGRLLASPKSDEQRKRMKAWLVECVKSILADEELAPKQNQWCPWCPLVLTCSETVRATDVWKGLLANLAPETKVGRATKVQFFAEGADLEAMMRDVLPRMQRTRKHIETVEKALKELIQQLPSEKRAELGWRLKDRRTKFLSPEGIRALHEALGPSFYEVVGLSRSAVETLVGKPKRGEETPEALRLMRELELERVSTTLLVHD